jgi:3-hydroxypropanoate dehydrogenase
MNTLTLTRPSILGEDGRDLLFREARTANSFSNEPVTDEQIDDIYQLMKWAPTGGNIQPLRILIIRSDEAKARLLPHMFEGNRVKTASAPAVAVLAADIDFHEQIEKLFPFRPEAKAHYEDIAVREPVGKFNAALQAGYFIVAVRAAGLAAGPMAGFDAAAIDAEFFTGTPLRSILVVNLGQPGENPWFERLPRLELEEAVRII